MKELRILSMSVFFGLVFAVVVAAYTFIYSATTQRDIAENVIRFHVRANSNTGDDQDLKNLVSAEVLDKFSANFSQYTDIADMRELFAQLLPEMEAYAQEIVRSKGYDYDVATSMESVFFPTQFYGDLAFPPGKYETVQILIGEGEGQNWWCLMFPPLCYVDMTATDAGQQQLAQTVSDESFRLLTHSQGQGQAQPQAAEMVVRFKVVEWWQNFLHDSTGNEKGQERLIVEVGK